jgi:hypothetical protein
LNCEETRLSSSITVAKYRALEKANDREALAYFIRERFEERYFRPVEDSCSKSGFASLAVSCLVVETLESFYQGLPDTRYKSAKMFCAFLSRDTPLKVFAGDDNWFFEDIRCGILHQGEVRNGWRVLRKGPLIDTDRRTINATQFIRALRKTVEMYAEAIIVDDDLWRNFQRKMKAICDNCCEKRPRSDQRKCEQQKTRI